MKIILSKNRSDGFRVLKSMVLIVVGLNAVLAQNPSSAPKQATGPSNLSNTGCRKQLLQSYSLTGIDMPIIERLEMCPNVVRSCCLKQDQVTIYNNFIQGGELGRITNYYNKVKGMYEEVLEQLTRVQDFAKAVVSNTKKDLSNCKLMAERILVYELSEVKPLIESNIDNLVDFFEKAHSSFYCTICNFDNHKFLDLNKKQVIFSEQFCREIIKETLPVLLMFHVDIVKLGNLAAKFVGSCDYQGSFNPEAIIPEELEFEATETVVHTLEDCRDHRNGREWFGFCKNICRQFEVNSFPEFFQPNLEMVDQLTEFIELKLLQHSKNSKNRPIYGALSVTTESPKLRILSETAGQKPPAQGQKGPAPGQKGPTPGQKGTSSSNSTNATQSAAPAVKAAIYQNGLSSQVDLTKFKSVFDTEEGIDYYQTHSINQETFTRVKTLLQLIEQPSKPVERFADQNRVNGTNSGAKGNATRPNMTGKGTLSRKAQYKDESILGFSIMTVIMSLFLLNH